LKEKWDERERTCGLTGSSKMSFYDCFQKEKADEMKESMLKAVRVDAGLGIPH